MLINPVVQTRHYIGEVEVITPRGIARRFPEVWDNTARKWLMLPTAPMPIGQTERGDTFWNAEEAIAFVKLVIAKQKQMEALGFKKRGRPRKAQ
jgi:hypothetical protein